MRERRRRSLDRFLSRCGVASRGEAIRLVQSGRVAVNGTPARDPGAWIDTRRDRVTLDGRPVVAASKLRVVVYNKQRGVLVTAHDPEGRPTLLEVLPAPFSGDRSLRTVGRLDRASAGLLILTNDHDLASRLLESDFEIPKTYRVKVSPVPSSRAVGHMQSGMNIGDRKPTAPCRVTMERKNPKSAVLSMVLTEGRNRQIRRMAAKVGCQVEWLVRTRFGPIDLGDLAPGEAREATPEELEDLLACVDLERDS